ncbi:heterokaryon incompatibility protein-domain-containing protein [Podospora conica]|nr:heterokaryon incompatibility protein-domain-containing protein [Schizothecium conicum]
MSSSQPRRGLWDDEDGGGPSNAAPSQRPTFPQLDANWINLDTILTWLTICREEHNCAKYPKFGSLPTHLIDVRRDCLVSAAELPADARYCALSYVWGQVRTGKLTTATRQAFCQPGAFSPESPTPVVIPKTVRHALGLVRELGEQYLWVDSFCIVQDGDDFSRELRNMGGIYDRAHLTIVAATAWDADDGLRGLRGLTPRRQVAPNYGDDLDKFTSDPDCMIWTSRGWTYQEALFSRRMVMFCDQTIIWKCLCSSVNEVGKSLPVDLFDGHVGGTFHLVRGKNPWEQKTHTEALSKSPVAAIKTTPRVSFRKRVEQKLNKRFRSGSHKALDALDKTAASNKTAARNKTEWEKALESPGPIPPFKDLEHYFQGLVKHYNTRSFTDASDLPRAFEGIAQALTQNATPGSLFSQGLCWGLPVANLCQALTWCAGEPSLRPRNQALGFPSWSWMAWEGSINAQAVPQWLDILPSSQAYAAAMIAERDIKSPSAELPRPRSSSASQARPWSRATTREHPSGSRARCAASA